MNRLWRFGLFEIDSVAGELRKEGRLVKLQDQPLQVLLLLVQRQGEIVSREDLEKEVWPADTFVDFDHGVNTAIKKIRLALGDSAENPRFIETLPRKGYRFIAPVSSSGSAPIALEPKAHLPKGRILAAVGLALALAWGGWWLVKTPKPASVPLRPQEMVTSYPGIETHPHFSPDGRRIAFSWDGGDRNNVDIYIKEVGMEVPVRLTIDPAQDIGPAFSPDGKRIAFLRDSGERKLSAFIVPVEGGPEVRISDASFPFAYPFPGAHLSWTPDGRSMNVHIDDPNVKTQSIRRIPISGGEPKWLLPLPTGARGNCCAAFSPDGRELAFVRFEEGHNEVYVQPLSSSFEPQGEARQITRLKLLASNPVWMPDGKSIVLSAGGTVRSFLWRVVASGKEPAEQLTMLGDDVAWPTVSRTGEIVYVQGHQESDIWTADLKAASPLRKIVSSNRQDLAAHFSADGRRIVFISSRSGENEVWIANADGTQPLRLTSMRASVTGWPSWSPDGSKILFDSNLSGSYHLYTISAAGGEPTQITSGNWNDGVARWSRDGKWIYFLSDRNGMGQIWKMPASGGGSPRQITKQGARLAMESPDGRHLYYAKTGERQSDLWRVSVEGGEEMLVLKDVSVYRFVPFGDGVYHIRPKAGGQSMDLIFHSWATGEDRVALNFIGRSGVGLDVTPDDRTFLFSQNEASNSDLMSVEFPR